MQLDFKVLVCGGREYGWSTNSNRQKMPNVQEVDYLVMKLNTLKSAVDELGRNLVIIQGEARGADTLAKKWAELNGVETLDFHADWDTHGKKAGFIRNSDMLKEGKPDLVIAFKGGSGTKMMCEIAEKANVPVKRY